MNLIIQFPIFIQPCTQKPLILYQLESVPVPILDKNTKAQSYTHLYSLEFRDIDLFETAGIKIMQKDWL